ncbi:hypothetical protein H257_01584 [Aphanomyces astaci]|uniref:PH domain-containing protein n=1 Tax=Aphanomyces astaci TaxID=112090 RepID=W4H8P5_APHAT|nr:hypothetical protein H257_01584 [Aphanomyces astaci]ETV88292.1 hypothetical protein H257_01584 [Aphanomyces astaci]|eukprot:XP_009823155.1 hypothetical protein H257_01584 [Aphanomyces astaci]
MKSSASLPSLSIRPPPAGRRDADDDDDFTIAVTNQTRHDRSKWAQLYKHSINDAFVHENIGPLLQRFESIDAFRRSRKRFTIGENTLPKLQRETRLRRDAVLALSRHRPLDLSFLKDDGVDASTLAIARTPFDADKWAHNARCEYCCKDGGDLACSLCNVIAHTACYLTAWKDVAQRYPTCFNHDNKWICIACEGDLQMEYDTTIATQRHNALKKKETSCALLICGYTRMVKEAKLFAKKRECAVRIQARIRGKLARNAFNEMQRLRIRPYTVELLRLRGLGVEGDSVPPCGEGEDGETRLPNGFLCNPYIVLNIVEDHDDDAQRFCFESEIQRGSDDVEWNEEIFVPGVNGNVLMCFTVLSKNGPNNFFLGQGAVRLNGTEIWRYGANLELKLKAELEIIPKIGHHQLMRIQDIGSLDKELTLSIRIRHFSEIGSYCGYMQSINTIDSVKGNSRWCVLADGTFRIYRHYGLTLAFETLKMVHASEVQLLQGLNHHRKTQTKKPTVLFIQHEQRAYLLTAESNKTNAVWVKKLQTAMKHKY